jgi:hypothetical protein
VDPHPATLDFVVLPPVWQQAWFQELVTVFVGIIGLGKLLDNTDGSRLQHLRWIGNYTAVEKAIDVLGNEMPKTGKVK